MIRSRALRVAAVLAATLVLGSAAVVTSFSDEDDPPPGPARTTGAGPDLTRPIAMPTGLVGLEVVLGEKEGRAVGWEGDVKVSQGRVVSLEVERSGPDAEVEGTHFKVGTANSKAAAKAKAKAKAKTNANQQATPKKKAATKKAAAQLSTTLLATIDAPDGATVTVTTGQGDFDVKLAELERDRPRTYLDGLATVRRQDPAVRLTGPDTEDDFPSVAKGPDGTVWLVNVAYRPERPQPLPSIGPDEFSLLTPTKNGDQVVLRRFDGKAWQPAIAVTEKRQDVWRPTVAVDGRGKVCVAWAQPIDGDWEIVRRTYTPARTADGEGSWSEVTRVTRAPGSDFHVVAATDAKGTVWLAWQARRDDNYEIMAVAVNEGDDQARPRRVSSSRANDWGPSIAADGKGGVFVAWDTYDKGNYDVWLRDVAGDGPPLAVAESPRFEARPHLAVGKDDRVWVAYEQGDEQWGKDYAHAGDVSNVGLHKNAGFALYVNRTVRVKCLDGGKLMQPAGSLDPTLASLQGRNQSVPRLAVDDDGGLWLLMRHHPLAPAGGEVWVGAATRYDGKAWSPLRSLPASTNLIDNRPGLAAVEGGLLAVYSGDHRTQTQNRDQDDLFAARLASEGSVSRVPDLEPSSPAPPATLDPVHPNEAEDIARMRAYRLEHGGKSLRLIRGEFHRHTEYTSHNDQDGLLEDAWRYALDAADHDWMGAGDHDNGFGHEYFWWTHQKVADLHHNAPRFVSVQCYERSVVYPNGHRNVIMPKRGIRPLPRGELPGTPEGGAPDTKLLYQYLKQFGGICASHTSGTNMGTDWRDNDPVVEPVVEIYQGHRHNYEHLGAPRSATAETAIGGYQPAGTIWNALAKGYRLAFQCSSDHVSTHLSYAILLTDDLSRQGVVDAFKKRHCYGATDNIILDVRSGEHLMGDEFETKEKPTLEIVARGTAPITKVHVIRDNKYVFSTEPGKSEVKLRYADDDAGTGQTHYYYVRVEQADGNLAWASPMWITVKE